MIEESTQMLAFVNERDNKGALCAIMNDSLLLKDFLMLPDNPINVIRQ